jgi:hypothetical protein
MAKRSVHLHNTETFSSYGSVRMTTGYELDGRGSIPGRDKVQTASGAHPVSCPTDTDRSISGVKQQGREADRSPPSSAKIKHGGATPPLPRSFSWRDA